MEGFALKGFITRNWFKLALALLLIFIVLKKDLSFQIRLRAPMLNEQQAEPPAERRSSRETLSEVRGSAPNPAETDPAPVDRFDFSGTGRNRQAGRGGAAELAALDEATKQAFIDRFARVAVNEHDKFDIPASLILGNALLLSRAGKNEMAREGNNFFALPCSRDWRGPSGTYRGSCYRRYENAWTSFRDHSLYLTTGKLAYLRENEGDDYKAWARALGKADFYQNGQTAGQVIELIENYRLDELDR